MGRCARCVRSRSCRGCLPSSCSECLERAAFAVVCWVFGAQVSSSRGNQTDCRSGVPPAGADPLPIAPRGCGAQEGVATAAAPTRRRERAFPAEARPRRYGRIRAAVASTQPRARRAARCCLVRLPTAQLARPSISSWLRARLSPIRHRGAARAWLRHAPSRSAPKRPSGSGSHPGRCAFRRALDGPSAESRCGRPGPRAASSAVRRPTAGTLSRGKTGVSRSRIRLDKCAFCCRFPWTAFPDHRASPRACPHQHGIQAPGGPPIAFW
jgi:hypothetical protein